MKALTVLPLVLFLASCTGKQGPVGPAGADGQNGVDGLDGAVNMTSRTITIRASDFISNGANTELADYTANEMTQDVVDNGTVLAFIDIFGTSNKWVALPVTLPSQGNVATLGYSYGPALFELILQHESTGSFAAVFAGSIIRIVVIPPGGSVSEADLDQILN